MINTAEQLKISVDDYLQGELISEIKHEYINGEVYAMAGAKRAHNLISGNVFGALFNHLRGTPCRVYGSDMKVGILTDSDDFFIILIYMLVAKKPIIIFTIISQN